MSQQTTAISRLGFEREVHELQEQISDWIDRCDEELHELLRWQFLGNSKYFRPLTIFSCYRAISDSAVPARVVKSAVTLEMFHNVSLILDDILDHSRYRRGKLTLHCRFGNLPALMASGYIVAQGFEIAQNDPHDIRLLAELLKRLGVAECLQWRLRRHPLGVEDWRHIAGEDTGSMFEVCACLGTRNNRLRKFGQLLGLLYHGCDDVGDVRGGEALGGGGAEDLRDGILTLPAAFAIRNPEVARLFRSPGKSSRMILIKHMEAKLPEAESYLDQIAQEAIEEAHAYALNPEPLIFLVQQTRQLSSL